MSLHLGNLSSRIRKDDLERAFRRFGRCTVQIKDKYGFVVFDYPASAEKALKTLRGKRICGEPITLSWSNRQPRALQRFDRGGKSYKPLRGRYSVKENDDQRVGSNGEIDQTLDFKQADGEGRKLYSSDLVDEARDYNPNDLKSYAGEKDTAFVDDFHEAGGSGKNHMEDDRWRDQVMDPSNETGLENGLEFDRYDPYHGDDRKELDEQQNMSDMGGSPTTRKGQHKTGTGQNNHQETLNHPNNPKYRRTCYACGEVGHKMLNCPLNLKRRESSSQGLLRQGSDAGQMRRQKSDREPSTSRNHQRLERQGDSPPARLTARGGKKEYRGKKRNRKDHESHEGHRSKKARVLSSSSSHSDYTASRLQSPSRSLSSISGSLSHSKSKSVSSRKKFVSSRSRSSTSHHFGSNALKSRMRSRSSSPASLALPVALDKHLSSPSSKMQTDYGDSVVNAVGSVIEKDLNGEEKLVKGTADSQYENITTAMENDCIAGLLKVEEEEMKEDLPQRDDADNNLFASSSEVLESYLPQSDNSNHAGENLSLQSEKEMGEPPNDHLMVDHALATESEISVRSNAANSRKLSSEEIYTVLKHYGLEHPKDNENDVPAESYFGSARLWPWEIIYYRRLKKGPISAENYARRIAQNKEFCIVDNYIRSSSGWDQLNEDNP